VLDKSGQTKTERVWNDIESLTSCINKLVEGEKAKAVLEAGRNWGIMYDFLESLPVITEVLLSDPFMTKAIAFARVKTDTIERTTLAIS
jgi:putative heme iron utilization protein